jgi:2,3-bisphosphoglycerate-independent phosphoglycerate mutase
MMTRAFKDGQKRQRLHLLLDGRDVGETSALIYVARIEGLIAELNAQGADIAIASGGGRMVLTMDRYEADWGMVASGWKHHVLGEGRRFKSAEEAIETYRAEGGFIDQFLPGFVIANDRGPLGKITDGDSVVLFNFRGDRAIEISRAFTEATLNTFDRGPLPHLCFAGMMEYDGDLKLPPRFLVGPPAIANTLGECLADRHIPQFAISETQKFGHVTYFWNGNRSGKFDENSETYLEIPSDQIPFETRPWMKCGEITDALIRELSAQPQRFFRVNFPNGDMVGHTGDFNATRIAMESLDIQLKRLLGVVEKLGGIALITADHGNADEMFELDKKGNPKEVGGKPKAKTSHTLAPVPFLFFDPHHQIAKRLSHDPDAGLANIAATITDILHLPPHPDWMRSLLTPP